LFAFACLSPWYIGHARPLRWSNLTELLFTWGAASVAGSLLLVGGVWLTASVLRQARPPQLGPLFGMGVVLYLLSGGVHYAALAAEASQEAARRAAEAHALAREAELQALRLQINPHFLFNSLHSIAALATVDGARAREMCVRLADFLRGSLGLGGRESVPLGEELALARGYLEVEQVRFGDRLRVDEDIEPACTDCAIPVLLLQPLVENAVKHGIAGMVEGGAIRLVVRRQGADVSVTVENAFDPDMPPPRNLGLGLDHVRRRLQLRYGEDAAFDAGARDGVYRVVLRFPCESPMASSKRA
ncbi:MAG TPA: histidine kinase, partial [Candidatus Solibacter sp.]|nr:histidine kinase [Candidatus Solibacter sp.]